MKANLQNIKTKRQKKNERSHITEQIAEICGCSTRHVRNVLTGKRTDKTELGERIWVAATILDEKQNLLLQEVKTILDNVLTNQNKQS